MLGRHPTNPAISQIESVQRGRGKKGGRKKQNFITRTMNAWWDRLLGAVSERTLSGQEEEYESHRTSRDYIWNTVGFASWGVVFPLLTIIVTQLLGAELAGMFSLAFVTATLLMIVANYGVRTYQVSDVEEAHSFADYRIQRLLTCVVMLGAGYLYCSIRGYVDEMFLMSMGVYFYKMIDGLADVYEGRLQQKDKLYLAGISQTLRSVVVFVAFVIALLVSGSLVVASIAMAAAATATLVIVTIPLSLFETPKSKRPSFPSIGKLFVQCFPVFLALFLYALVDNMPKFVMEGSLSYDNQLYFNALYFPAQAILLTVGFIYKPLLVRMANAWADVKHRKRFDLFIFAMVAIIIAITAVGALFMNWIGIPIISFLYGIDFEPMRDLALIMLVAGGVTGCIDFLYQVITVIRRQGVVTKLYLITFGFSLLVLILLINITGLPGAVIGYLIVMTILLVLLVWEYIRVRIELHRNPETDSAAMTSDEEDDDQPHAVTPASQPRTEVRRTRAAAPETAEAQTRRLSSSSDPRKNRRPLPTPEPDESDFSVSEPTPEERDAARNAARRRLEQREGKGSRRNPRRRS